MLANNEIGVDPAAGRNRRRLPPSAACRCIATPRRPSARCRSTSTQLGVDLMSFSAPQDLWPQGHRRAVRAPPQPRVRLRSRRSTAAGRKQGLRSGTLNVPGIVGFARRSELCLAEMPAEAAAAGRPARPALSRADRARWSDVTLNGPRSDIAGLRLPGNLNVSFAYVNGEALMMSMQDLAVSSGSACTSANPEPSHVLRALGWDEDSRASLRFGLGRFNTAEEVEFAIAAVAEAVNRLRKLSSMA